MLTEDERDKLQQWARRPKTSQRLELPARIVLGCADGIENRQVPRQLRITDQTVCKWREWFRRARLEGLADEPRPGAPHQISDAQVKALITRTLESVPPQGTHWSTRTMAEAIDMSQSALSRVWWAFSLQQHRVETFPAAYSATDTDGVSGSRAWSIHASLGSQTAQSPPGACDSAPVRIAFRPPERRRHPGRDYFAAQSSKPTTHSAFR